MNLSYRGLPISFIGLLLFGMAVHGYAQQPRDTLSILFIGNSYTYSNNLPQIVSLLSESTTTYLSTRQSTAPGAMLSQHWHGKKGLKTKSIIEEGNFDVVVLQDHSMAALDNPDSLENYVLLFADLCKTKGAQVVLYQTWARDSLPETQEAISHQYNRIAENIKAEVVRAGDAWSMMKKDYPQISLFNADGSHPNDSGTFLNAYLFATTLCKQNPELIKSEFSTRDLHGEFIQLMYIEKEYFQVVEKVSSYLEQVKK